MMTLSPPTLHTLQAYSSGTRDCAFWRNATSGNLTDTPHATRVIHASGYYQTPTMATMFTRIYEVLFGPR